MRKTFVLKINVTHTCQVSKEVALKMYREMVTLHIMDNIFYEAQRQGRISFYLTSNGEEAINIASAAALSIDDIVLPQVQHQSLRHSIAYSRNTTDTNDLPTFFSLSGTCGAKM